MELQGAEVHDVASTPAADAAKASRRAAAIAAVSGEIEKAAPNGASAEAAPAEAVAPETTEAVPEEAKAEPGAAKPDDTAERRSRIAKFLAEKGEKSESQKLRLEFEQFKAQAAAREEQIRTEAIQSVLSQLQNAPSKLFEDHKLPPNKVLEAAMEEVSSDPVKKLERETQKLYERLEQERKAREELAQTLQERERAQVVQQGKAEAISTVFNAKESFPFLNAKYEDVPDQLAMEIAKVGLQVHNATGQYPSYADVAEYLELQELERYNNIKSRFEGVSASAPSRRATAKIKGISAADAATRASGAAPKPTTREERLAAAREAYELAYRQSQQTGTK